MSLSSRVMRVAALAFLLAGCSGIRAGVQVGCEHAEACDPSAKSVDTCVEETTDCLDALVAADPACELVANAHDRLLACTADLSCAESASDSALANGPCASLFHDYSARRNRAPAACVPCR